MNRSGDGRFFASQAADEGFYQLPSAALRRTFTPPRVDRTLFTDWTAQASSVWIAAGQRLGDPSLSEFGGRALDRALVASYRPGEGLAHWVDGRAGVRGLLTDQVHASRALLDLHEATANPTWSMMAEELMRTAIRQHRMWFQSRTKTKIPQWRSRRICAASRATGTSSTPMQGTRTR